MITHEWSDWRNGDIWWVQSVYVDKEFRRRGVFRALYAHVRKLAIHNGAIGIRLYVDAHNHTGQRTYISLGMRETNYKLMEEMFTPAQAGIEDIPAPRRRRRDGRSIRSDQW